MVFTNDIGKRMTMSLPHARQTSTALEIRVLVDKLIEHSNIFVSGSRPVEFVGAEYFITDRVPIADV
jgi:hypothetical protein